MKTIKIVLHIDEELDSNSRQQLERDVTTSAGIQRAHINEKRHHLMLVDYSPQQMNTGQVLQQVSNKGFHAELIGGI